MQNDKLRLTFYEASAIEHNSNILESENWKEIIKKELSFPDIGIYNPTERETQKTGKTVEENIKYISNLKRSGHYKEFHDIMTHIWWGGVNDSVNRVETMTLLRSRFLIDGNSRADLNYFGDYEAVLRSDFIIAYKEKNVKTIGTICEIHICYLFNIPVYLILPDQTKTEANSTLIDLVIKSGGNVFYDVNSCVKYIKEIYKI